MSAVLTGLAGLLAGWCLLAVLRRRLGSVRTDLVFLMAMLFGFAVESQAQAWGRAAYFMALAGYWLWALHHDTSCARCAS